MLIFRNPGAYWRVRRPAVFVRLTGWSVFWLMPFVLVAGAVWLSGAVVYWMGVGVVAGVRYAKDQGWFETLYRKFLRFKAGRRARQEESA